MTTIKQYSKVLGIWMFITSILIFIAMLDMFLVGYLKYIREEVPVFPAIFFYWETIATVFMIGMVLGITALVLENREKRGGVKKPSLGWLEQLVWYIKRYYHYSFWTMALTIGSCSLLIWASDMNHTHEIGLKCHLIESIVIIALLYISLIVAFFRVEEFEKKVIEREYRIPWSKIFLSLLLFLGYLAFLLAILFGFINVSKVLPLDPRIFATIIVFLVLQFFIIMPFWIDQFNYPIRKWILNNVKCPDCSTSLKICKTVTSNVSFWMFWVYCERCRSDMILKTGIFDRTLRFSPIIQWVCNNAKCPKCHGPLTKCEKTQTEHKYQVYCNKCKKFKIIEIGRYSNLGWTPYSIIREIYRIEEEKVH